MFGRRVSSCCPIPTAMYRTLHINNRRQAQRLVAPFVALSPRETRVAATDAFALQTGVFLPADLATSPSLSALMGLPAQALLNGFVTNPILLRIISDTMCTYSVLLLHT
ncbi:hypothetical protein TraAM80_02338 [Trypanosoma rangeli]|uniref:Uncharacterized protein n=1 Tax=Trypanosoma rangeli TaxID=5698 RepID=A0A422NUP2_TRYRA|nr:uncharacterized protein TraAM80_02338 [Trypanosoma rangeli]RNF09193.1 hypothetical protein TraAM80_02338 [Trypanosoma rangeli]|eukprot:RNF09193.1 hypothetical protein TraAM80_02338 [Trypanosoma rangeli]